MNLRTTLAIRKTCAVIGLVASQWLGGMPAAVSAEKIAPKTLQFLEATTISGYVQSSYQKSWGANGAAGDPGTTPARAFNANRNGFDVDQVKLTLEKPVGDGETGAGYRVDLLYGKTANVLSTGNGGTDSFFLEQAYLQFRLPVGTGVDVKFGRFVTLLGNEVIDAPANWNYSRSYIFSSEPLTHTGALLSYKWNDLVDTQFGVVNGYSDFAAGTPAIADTNSAKSITGRVGVTLLGGQLVFSTIGIAGAEHGGNNNGTRWVVNEVVTYNPKWNEKWTFALEGIYGRDSRMDAATGVAGAPEALWWGVAGYTKYQWLAHFSTALRAESMSFNGSAQSIFGWSGVNNPTTLAGYNAKGHVEDITLSCSFDNIWRNLTPRLEVRYDRINPSMFGSGAGDYNHNGIRSEEHT
ncbi:MAG: outer membrane beta-barrel protein, partial [Verrucomicrobia bacterium]|nr:outer membrane beta-barrel protein [Verrucomicrobiota bacterium]